MTLAGADSGSLVLISILVVAFLNYKLSAAIVGGSPSARLGLFGSCVEEAGLAGRSLLGVGRSLLDGVGLVMDHISQWLPASIPIPVDPEIADSDQPDTFAGHGNVSPYTAVSHFGQLFPVSCSFPFFRKPQIALILLTTACFLRVVNKIPFSFIFNNLVYLA